MTVLELHPGPNEHQTRAKKRHVQDLYDPNARSENGDSRIIVRYMTGP